VLNNNNQRAYYYYYRALLSFYISFIYSTHEQRRAKAARFFLERSLGGGWEHVHTYIKCREEKRSFV
jgi:hypothetical protein